MTIGFFGTQFGLTPEQIKAITDLLRSNQSQIVRHGAETRADYAFHHVALSRSKNRIIAHPTERSIYLSEKGFAEVLPEQKPEIRDYNLIQESTKIILAGDHPKTIKDRLLKTNLDTVKKLRKDFIIVSPKGICYEA